MNTIIDRLKTELNQAEQEKQRLEARLESKPDFGPGEGATMVTSWEMTLARTESVSSRIEALQAALTRVDDGTYGVCDNCGNRINSERLEILPTVQLCAPCAQR